MKLNILRFRKCTLFFSLITFHIFASSQTQVVAGSRCNKTAHLAGRASVIPGTAGSRSFQKSCSLRDFWPRFQTQEAHLHSRYCMTFPELPTAAIIQPTWEMTWFMMWAIQGPDPTGTKSLGLGTRSICHCFFWLWFLLPVPSSWEKKQPYP